MAPFSSGVLRRSPPGPHLTHPRRESWLPHQVDGDRSRALYLVILQPGQGQSRCHDVCNCLVDNSKITSPRAHLGRGAVCSSKSSRWEVYSLLQRWHLEPEPLRPPRTFENIPEHHTVILHVIKSLPFAGGSRAHISGTWTVSPFRNTVVGEGWSESGSIIQ